MVKLAELWSELKSLSPDDPARADIQRKINEMEKWCIERGYKNFKVTRWNNNEFNASPNYPDKVGAIYYKDIKLGNFRAILLSAVANGNNVYLKFYEPITNRVILWKDPTEYKPYCYVTPEVAEQMKEIQGIESMEPEQKINIIDNAKRDYIKVTCKDNFIINKIVQTYKVWEGDIRLQNSYLYDKDFQVGKWYELHENYIQVLDSESSIDLGEINVDGIIEKEKFLKNVGKWAKLLDEEIPQIRRLAFDIETEITTTFPDPSKAEQRVTAISFESEDINKVFVLRTDQPLGEDMSTIEDIVWFDSEKEMLKQAFDIIESYPVCLTYNGDEFDLPYLYNRAVFLGIENIPFTMIKDSATLSTGIHIDLYKVFKNRSLKIYAFKAKYVEDGLGSVSQALLGETKIGGEIKDMTLYKLAHYCYNDSRLTYKLSSYNNNLVMNLLVIISRISNSSIDECSRYAISHWILSLLYYTHRQNNELIPKSDDFPQKDASTKSVGDKKYEGAIVLEPVAGVHFDVKVMDFASLYPSIIKVNNVSYETVNCNHAECEANKVPYTQHWICTKKTGVVSSVIGSLKELRVGHFKKLSKIAKDANEKTKYETISEALKVFLNASYGVIGYEKFPLYYLPTAETITAYGRNNITKSVEFAKENGMQVIYGDTDSIFIKQPTQEQIDSLIKFAKENIHIDLEQDKSYRYVVLSNRRKNYFGIKIDGTTDIKGLSGKKSNTPKFIRDLFTNILENLKTVNHVEDFERTKQFISNEIKKSVMGFDALSFGDLSYKVLIRQATDSYKIKPLAVRAAEQLGEHVHVGTFV